MSLQWPARHSASHTSETPAGVLAPIRTPKTKTCVRFSCVVPSNQKCKLLCGGSWVKVWFHNEREETLSRQGRGLRRPPRCSTSLVGPAAFAECEPGAFRGWNYAEQGWEGRFSAHRYILGRNRTQISKRMSSPAFDVSYPGGGPRPEIRHTPCKFSVHMHVRTHTQITMEQLMWF